MSNRQEDIPWEEIDPQLGKVPDRELAKLYGLRTLVIAYRRNQLDIRKKPKLILDSQQVKLLGTQPDTKLAELWDTNHTAVAKIRRELGIKQYIPYKRIDWDHWDQQLLNTDMSAGGLAKLIGCHIWTVRARLRALRGDISGPYKDMQRGPGGQKTKIDSGAAIEMYLSGLTQEEVADKLRCGPASVSRVLRKKQIKTRARGQDTQKKELPWEAIDKHLGVISDVDIARRYAVPTHTIAYRRRQLGIESAPRRQQKRCRACGKKFLGSPRAQYCRHCRRDQSRKERAAVKERRASGNIAPYEHLLYGPYLPPKVKRGDWLFDERAGEVAVGGYSDAPLSWPYRLKTGTRSLILCGDLVRAVQQESEVAVSYWWGVCAETVWAWRKALGVARMTPGTTEAYRSVMPNKLPPDVVAKGREKISTPEVRAKMAKTRTGQPAPPSVRAGLLRAAKAPKSEEWKRKRSELIKKQWDDGTRTRQKIWTDEKIEELRVMKEQGKTDRECAEALGVTINAIRDTRKRGRKDPRFAALASGAQSD